MARSKGKFTGAMIVRVVIVAVVVAIIATFIQRAIFGASNPAITGGLASAVAVIMLMGSNRRRQESLEAEGPRVATRTRAEIPGQLDASEEEKPRK